MRVLALLLTAASLHAQYYDNYFGANKVNYTIFDWKILETEHFEIYYYPEMRELAERAAGMAEEQYVELQNLFNYSVKRKIPMIIYSSHLHFQQTNVSPFEIPEGVGGFFEFFKGRVVLPSDGSTHAFRRVLRHELVHVFATYKMDRILSDHRKLSHPGAPLWFTEGIAEYWSGKPDFQAEMVMRDAVVNGTVVPIRNFYTVHGTYYMYKLGENLMHFIDEQYGPEKIMLIIDNIWKSETFEKVVQMSIGENYDQINERWQHWLKKKYFPSLGDRDEAGGVTKKITDNGFNVKPAVWWHDGVEEIFYVANHDGYTNIYRQRLDSKDAEVVIKGERSEDFETFHFFKSKIDVSKNGELAFVTKSGEKDVLHVYDVLRKKITHRYRYKDLVGLASPSWSPDGRRIVFSGLSVSGNSDLYILDVRDDRDDGRLEKLTNDHYDDKEPAWSPDGRTIAFSSDRLENGLMGAYNLFFYDTTAKKFYTVTAGHSRDDAPAWSRDGSWLAFTSSRPGEPTDMWVLPFKQDPTTWIEAAAANDSAALHRMRPRELLRLTTAGFDPVWTNNGDLIFTSFEKFSFQIRSFANALGRAKEATTLREEALASAAMWQTPKVPLTTKNTRPYTRKYGLDFVQGSFHVDPVFGNGGGGLLGITDVLGNEQYYLLVFNTSRTTSQLLTNWNFVLTKVDLGQRVNFAYGFYRFRGDFLEIDDVGDIAEVDQNRFGGFFQVLYPLSRFDRLETSINVSKYDRESIFGQVLPVDGLIVSNFAGYTFDNSLWGITGPLDGTRFSVSAGYTTDIQRSQQNYYSAIFDYRKYFRLTTRSAFAFRSMVQWNEGKNPQNFILGGSWDLRGYPRWNLPGTRFFVVNSELRFPFVDAINLRLPFGGLGFRGIRGAVFMDVGNAWGSQISDGAVVIDHVKFDGLIGSVGTGFRVNMLGFLVLRFDFGKMFDARGYEFAGIKLPGNRDRFIATKLKETGDEGFGGILDNNGALRESRRWSRGTFFQFWFGADF